MTYTANIPQPGDDPSQSQDLILQNFQQLNVQYGTSGDHVEWSASSANGKHKKTSWINQIASEPVPGLNEVVAYGVTQSGVTMPYYKRDGLATRFSLAPIKAYVLFTTSNSNFVGNTNVAVTDQFNIPGPIVQNYNGAGVVTFTITMTEACRSVGSYGIFFNFNRFQPTFTYSRTNAQVFVLTSVGSSYIPNVIGPIDFCVYVTET